MMGEMFGGIGPEDKMDFVSQMMPVCIGKIFENLEKEDRVETALAILEKLKEELEKQAK